MEKKFSNLHIDQGATLYTITGGGLSAVVSDLGATLVRLMVPDAAGNVEDVVLGYDTAKGYLEGTSFLGATVGRSANRIAGASFSLGKKTYALTPNEGKNNLHSGPNCYNTRLWALDEQTESSVQLSLESPDGDQGMPGNAHISVTYSLDGEGGLHIVYDGLCDQDTIFNMTNHSYFNLAGHQHTDKAIHQILSLPGRHFCPDDAESIPTGEKRSVEGTPMDFRTPKPICRDIDCDYEPLHLQGGYDHNWEVFCNPCATLTDPDSGRTMSVYTDCPGIQFYSGNFLNEAGKDGVHYGKHAGIALETQFYPDSIHEADWAQPVVEAGKNYHSETVYRFSCK